jgi:hypothetical protein
VTLSLLCKHKSGGWYHQRKEEKRPCCALGQARDPVIQGDPGANKMLQRIEDHCNVHHKLHELGMHQLDAPKVTPKEPAVKFYNHNRQQQCNISTQAQEALQSHNLPPIIHRHSELRKSDYRPEKTPMGNIKGMAWPSSIERRLVRKPLRRSQT